jgi:hypothetical protein
MGYPFRYIVIALASLVTLLSVSSCGKKGVIDEDDMSLIYAEMLVTDQWINNTPGMRMIADTSLVYEPILKKYGYDSEDYRRSVEYYLKDPDTYADIMKETVRILDGRLAELNHTKNKMDGGKEMIRFVKSMARDVKLHDSWLAINLDSGVEFRYEDSLSVEWDSLSRCFSMSWVPRKHVADSLLIRDSVALKDSIAPSDKFTKPVTVKDGALKLKNDTLFRKRSK